MELERLGNYENLKMLEMIQVFSLKYVDHMDKLNFLFLNDTSGACLDQFSFEDLVELKLMNCCNELPTFLDRCKNLQVLGLAGFDDFPAVTDTSPLKR
jgi:hypothetical protein